MNAVRNKPDKCIFLCYSNEVGSNGTPHIQGCLQWSSRVRRSTISNYLPRAHIESSMGIVCAALHTMKTLQDKEGSWCFYNDGEPILQQPDYQFLRTKEFSNEEDTIQLLMVKEDGYSTHMAMTRYFLMKGYPGFVHLAYTQANIDKQQTEY